MAGFVSGRERRREAEEEDSTYRVLMLQTSARKVGNTVVHNIMHTPPSRLARSALIDE
jgi:hypothetical protein